MSVRFRTPKGSYFRVDINVQGGFGVPNKLWEDQGFTLDFLKKLGAECHKEAKALIDNDPWDNRGHIHLLPEPHVIVQEDAIHIHWEHYSDELIDLGTAA